MKIQQAWDRIQSQFQDLNTAEEAVGGAHGNSRLGGKYILDCVVFSRLSGVTCARNILGDRVKVTPLAVLANEGKAERSKSDQAIVVGGDWVDMSTANTELENDGSMVLLDNSSFCGGTLCRDAVCVGVLRNGHSHAMDGSEIDEAKLHACNGQNITNMTYIEIVIHQPPNKAECPTPEIYPGLATFREASQCGNRRLADGRHKSEVAKGRMVV